MAPETSRTVRILVRDRFDLTRTLRRIRLHHLSNTVWWPAMGHNKGKDIVKKRKARRLKAERLHAAKLSAKASS
jgi:hypothetical protein